MAIDGYDPMIKVIRETAPHSDEELLRRMMAGDADAFEQLYDRRQPGIYQFALRMSGSPELADDVTQDVFIEFMRDAHLFDPSKGTVGSYLFGMVRHRVLKRLNRERKFVAIADAEEKEEESPFESKDRFLIENNPFGDFQRSETVEAVRQAILSLPEHYREVVVLVSLHEMSYEQTAEMIGCPVGTVRSRLNRARTMLLDKLQLLRTSNVPTAHLAHAGSEV